VRKKFGIKGESVYDRMERDVKDRGKGKLGVGKKT
jgi:hypothetical protein